MKKLISKLTLSLVLFLSFGMTAEAQLAKSGKFSGTFNAAGKVVAVHMLGEAPVFILAEIFGGSKNDAGSGIFHMSSFKCTFANEVVQMPKTVGNGYCTLRDADGDLFTIRASEKGSLVGSAVGATTFVHGTGKYKGITGSGWYKGTPLPEIQPGTFQITATMGGTYKLP